MKNILANLTNFLKASTEKPFGVPASAGTHDPHTLKRGPQTLPSARRRISLLALRTCLKTVASAILADVESGFQPGGENLDGAKRPVNFYRFRHANVYSGRQDAALYGRPGGPPLLFKQALSHLLVAMFIVAAAHAADQRPPNIVIIFTDDQGYQDVGCFGSPNIKTPNLDRMAKEGVRFTDFYVGQPVCSASRAALLTGCYPNRIGILGALGPGSKVGIHSNELTIAEVLKPRGYATAIYGKWHLGDAPQFLPPHHGFDDYFGLPYSNDMWPHHPTSGKNFPPLPLIEGDQAVSLSPDQTQLTTWYTEHAVKFIRKNKRRPFLLYVAHNMPHVPLHVSDKFKGKSARGLYGDVIMEIDWSVGQILGALKKNGLDEQTLVIFTSDNGPWLLYGDHAGAALPLREGKATTFEGGLREPCIMRWPGKIPAGTVCRELAATMDILPTVARLAGADLPKNKIDGLDIWPLMSGQPGAKSPHEAYFYYWGKALQAVRSGKWKLHVSHDYPRPEPPGGGGKPGKYATKQIGTELFDLENDIGETTNVDDQHPEVVKRLEAFLEQSRDDLGDSQTKREGKNVRLAGQLTADAN